MGYSEWYLVQRISDTVTAVYTNAPILQALKIDTATANTTKLFGQTATGKSLKIYANQTDTNPFVYLGSDKTSITSYTDKVIELAPAGTGKIKAFTKTAHADQVIDGYITMQDSAGNALYLAALTPV